MSEACQPSLWYAGSTVKPGVPAGTMIARDLRRAVVVGAGARGDGDDRGDVGAGVGDERLGAVDDPLVAVADGAGAGGAGVGAAVGLGQAEAASARPATRSGRKRCLLLLAAEA